MERYRIRLADQAGELYSYESFETEEEATETAAFQCANHKLPFEVLGPDPRDSGSLIVLNRFAPYKGQKGVEMRKVEITSPVPTGLELVPQK